MVENNQCPASAVTSQDREQAGFHVAAAGTASDKGGRDPKPMVFCPGAIGSEDVVAYGPSDLIFHKIGVSVDAVRQQWGPEAANVYQNGIKETK